MRLSVAALWLLLTVWEPNAGSAFTAPPAVVGRHHSVLGASVIDQESTGMAAAEDETADSVDPSVATPMELKVINDLPFRLLRLACEQRGIDTAGTMGQLRARLRNYGRENDECTVDSFSGEPVGDCDTDFQGAESLVSGISFINQSDPDFEFNELLKETEEKIAAGHWKAATRKLKKLTKNYVTPERQIPEHVYVGILKACMANRLHGARASEPARKVMEEMADHGVAIPLNFANYCVQNCLGEGEGGKHDGCGGIDTALAMIAAIEASPGGDMAIQEDTLGKVVASLAGDGAVDEALVMLKSMIVERSLTPPLSMLADIALKTANTEPEQVPNVLAFAKAAGYELDSIASLEDGRALLAAGVIAAEKMNNVALGLRLLTAASKATMTDETEDGGDVLVANHSAGAQRASALVHKRAVGKAAKDNEWKLAVRLLELMLARKLNVAPTVWRSVVSSCAKAGKSRKSTALLLDWVKLAEAGEADKPPVSVFNTVVNACEICDEQELTLVVLETMKKTHETDGNIITFNIALKRLAKLGNEMGCEGIIIGMLESGVEPSVVTYTTAIAACATEPKNPTFANEWLRRMRSRQVSPNTVTYNTALASCLDGKLESTAIASKIAGEMVVDAAQQLALGVQGDAAFTSAMPDSYTKSLVKKLMIQLRDNWRSGAIDIDVAKATLRKPLLQILDFGVPAKGADKSESTTEPKSTEDKSAVEEDVYDTEAVAARDEAEIEMSSIPHRKAEV